MPSRVRTIFFSLLAGILVGFFLAYSFRNRGVARVFLRQSSTQPQPKVEQLPPYHPRLSAASYTEVEDRYYERITRVHVKCSPAPRIGRAEDGGWDVCMAPAFKPKKPCLVYSFGVNGVWEFDETLARDYGCTVRAFDPSMRESDHVHKPGPVNFYKIGLAGSNRTQSNGWKLLTFRSLLAKFGEADRTLDLVKIDIEYSEWESFQSMLATGVLERTKQLMFETHTKDVTGGIPSKQDYLRYHKILDAIEALGFRRFLSHANSQGVGPVTGARSRTNDPVYKKSANLRRTCCHEVYYVNMRFATDATGLTQRSAT